MLDSRAPVEGEAEQPAGPADGYADDEAFEPAPSRSTRG